MLLCMGEDGDLQLMMWKEKVDKKMLYKTAWSQVRSGRMMISWPKQWQDAFRRSPTKKTAYHAL